MVHIPRRFLLLGLLLLLSPVGAAASPPPDSWLPASSEKLPRWRGFNLLNYFMLSGHKPFEESDFQLIHELGFNFVRLPMDYRIWIANGDWTKIDEQALVPIDQAVQWGEKYHIHVCLNFHRAPGFTVAEPKESRSLWTDPEAQRVCALHWAAFARRYQGIPNERFSFNLVNEPTNVDPQVYATVVGKLAEAIRREDPNRLIIADGLAWGTIPCPELIPLHVAEANHCYSPMWLTHYHASWVKGSEDFPMPVWPCDRAEASAYLYGPSKGELHLPLVLKGNFPAGTRIDFTVGTVSIRGRVIVKAGSKVLLDQKYVSTAKSTQGEKVVYNATYDIYQNVFNESKQVVLDKPASQISIGNDDGDWIRLGTLSISLSGGPTYPLFLLPQFGEKQQALTFDPGNAKEVWSRGKRYDSEWLWQEEVVPWQGLEAKGVGVMVGEWGCFNQTPHDVAMSWMEDKLVNFQKAGWGWALWNFTGSFGVLDSDRPDVVYEDFHGHKLDRQMLDLLQKY